MEVNSYYLGGIKIFDAQSPRKDRLVFQIYIGKEQGKLRVEAYDKTKHEILNSCMSPYAQEGITEQDLQDLQAFLEKVTACVVERNAAQIAEKNAKVVSHVRAVLGSIIPERK